jgi:hypothetical protein
MSDWSCFCAVRKVQNQVTQMVLSGGQTEDWKALKPRVKAAKMPNWAKRKSMWEMGVGSGRWGRKASFEMWDLQ